MAIAATIVWELRTTGDDGNGGGYKTGASGTDYSQQASPQATLSGATQVHSTTTQINVNAGEYTVSANDVGNIVRITGGTATPGAYEITAVDVPNNRWTVDRSAGTSGQTVVGRMGGALLTPGLLGSLMAAGNDAHCASGTYSITNASQNIPSGCFSGPANVSSSNATRIVGYGSTRGDNGTKPIWRAGNSIATFTLVTLGAGSRFDNFEIDGNNYTSSRGVSIPAGAETFRCKGLNCTNTAFFGSAGGSKATLCSATTCSTQFAFGVGIAVGCTAYSNTITGFSISNVTNCVHMDCLAVNNSGASSYGFGGTSATTGSCINCTAYGNGSHGFFVTVGATSGNTFLNCLASGNTGAGFSASATYEGAWLYYCAVYNNTGGTVTNIAAAQQIGLVTLTGDPFTNAAGLDFSLNNTGSAGAACRAAGMPVATSTYSYPDLATTNYRDIGASQHADPGGGGGGGASVIGSSVIVPVFQRKA